MTFSDQINKITLKYFDKLAMDYINSISLAHLYAWKIKFGIQVVRAKRGQIETVFIIDEKNEKKIRKHMPNWNGRVTSPV